MIFLNNPYLFILREVVFKDHYTNGSEPTMKSILQESNIFSINAIVRFLKEVDLLDKI